MKQTAVEFYHSELKKILYNVIVTPEQVLKMEDALTQAKEMEKQVIENAVNDTQKYLTCKNDIKLGEIYYNETFKQK